MDIDHDPAVQALEALPDALTAVQENPLRVANHYKALELIEATGMDDQLEAARLNFVAHLAATDGVCISPIDA